MELKSRPEFMEPEGFPNRKTVKVKDFAKRYSK
jgi:hypothetical protein